MANTKNSKKNVKRSKSSRKQHAEYDKKIPIAKNKVRRESKQITLIELLTRSGGATINEMAKAIGWQLHSIRGMMSGVLKKRLGLSIASEKEERGRVYRIAA
jgi:hypothetical protein